MNTNIKVSIVVPLYNGERFIETALRSVLDFNIPWVEFVVVNDGSKDSSESICRKYQCDCLQYISIENSGAGYARNRGIEAARGEWVTFLDSDDMMFGSEFDAEWLEYLNSQYNSGTDIIYMPKVECDMELTGSPQITYPENVADIVNFIPKIEFWSCFYRTSYLRDNNIHFFEYQKQDVESAFRFKTFSNTEKIVVKSDKVFIVHRNNPTSNVNTWKVDDLYEIKARVYLQLFEEFHNKVSSVSRWLYGEYAYFLRGLILNSLHNGFPKAGEGQLREMIMDYAPVIRKENNTPISLKNKVFFALVRLLKKEFVWKIFANICKRKIRQVTIKDTKNIYKFDDTETLLDRLKDYRLTVYKELKK